MGRNLGAIRAFSCGILAFSLGAAAQEAAPDESERTVPAIRAHIYERFGEIQTCIEEGDTDCALDGLARLGETRDLNSFEKANVQSLYAITYFDREDYEGAAGAYEIILELPRNELPEGFVQAAMRNLSSTYWNLERPRDALALLDEWIALPTTQAGSSDWYLKGTMHYELEEFAAGAGALREAIAIANRRGEIGEENWYRLLAALYSELGETDDAIDTLTTLATHWTKRSHVLQLAGQLSLAGRDNEVLSLYEAAYEAGWLRSSQDLVSLASLFLQAEIPYKAAAVLEAGLASGNVESNERNWNLLGQAWQSARNHDEAIAALEQASRLAENGEADIRLARSLALRARWEECIAASNRGFERGGISAPGIARIQLGQCHFYLRQWDEAEAAFEQAEQVERTRENAREWLSYVLSRRNTERENEQKLREAEANVAGE